MFYNYFSISKKKTNQETPCFWVSSRDLESYSVLSGMLYFGLASQRKKENSQSICWKIQDKVKI